MHHSAPVARPAGRSLVKTRPLGLPGAALPALLLGAFLVFTAGFAHPDRVHDAAHDTRHSYGLPCH